MLLHSILIGMTLAASAIAFALRSRAAKGLLGFLALLFVVVVVWSAKGAGAASKSAAEVADGQPFCIQVQAPRRDYRPVVGLVELSRLSMLARNGSYFHGVMVAGNGADRKLYNWSHWRNRWDELPEGGEGTTVATIRCVPRADFANRLTWWPDADRAGQPRGLYAHIHGRSYLIDREFHGRASGNHISFHSQGTDFRPVPASELETHRGRYMNSLEFRSRSWMEGLLENRDALDLLSVRAHPALRPGPGGSTLYVGRDATGTAHTVVICGPETARNPTSCQHIFYADGAMWTFRHRLRDLVRWRKLQAAYRERFSRFEAAAARCEARTC